VETSGVGNNADLEALELCEEVIVSPKIFARTNFDVLARATALKVLAPVSFNGYEIETMVKALGSWGRGRRELVVQPITPQDGIGSAEKWSANSAKAIEFAEERIVFGESWRVIPQTHVFMGVR
jgi:hypothetical protein